MADDTLKDALTNPKRILSERERKAMGEVPDGSAGRDMGDLPGNFQMKQSTFSGYDRKKPSGPPAEMLKNRK